MKNRSFLWTFFALTTLVAFTACKKDNSGTAANSTSANISGTTFQSSIAIGVNLASQNNMTLTFFQAKGGDTSAIMLNFPDTLQLNKAYTIGAYSTIYLSYQTKTDDYETSFDQPSGSITITSLNKSSKNIQGTYNAFAYKAGGDSVIIKDGKFNATYLVE